jgi:hypothetical protein
MSVAISLAIAPLDPNLHSENLPTPPPLPVPEKGTPAEVEEPSPAVVVVPAKQPEASTEQPAPTGSPSTLKVHAALGGDAALGRAPSVAGGVLLAFETRWQNFSVGIEGHALLPAQKSVTGGAIQTSLVEAVVDPCFRRGLLGICGLVGAGVQSATGIGFPVSTSSTGPLLSVGGRVLVQIPLVAGVELWLLADVLTPLIQASVKVDNIEEWRAPAASLALGGALGVSIP